jgi:hypothetical protein
MKTRTLARLFTPLSTVFVLGVLALPPAQVAPASAPPRPAYRFALVQGQDVAVCEAYLARLNMTEYQDPPYCDRLENDAIPGFTRLQRVPLSAEAVQALLPRVRGFTEQKNQDLYDIENARRQRDGLPLSQPLSDVKTSLGRDIKVWRYDPPVDIDNDGVPDNVEVWHGFGASGYTGRCGQESPYDKGRQVTLRQTQIAYVLTPTNDRIDVFQTMTIFGHPSGGYRIPDKTGRGTFSSKFRPVGPSIGIFKYQERYYFQYLRQK